MRMLPRRIILQEKMLDRILKSELIEILRHLFKLLLFVELAPDQWNDYHLNELERYCKIGFGIDQDDPLVLFEQVKKLCLVILTIILDMENFLGYPTSQRICDVGITVSWNIFEKQLKKLVQDVRGIVTNVRCNCQPVTTRSAVTNIIIG